MPRKGGEKEGRQIWKESHHGRKVDTFFFFFFFYSVDCYLAELRSLAAPALGRCRSLPPQGPLAAANPRAAPSPCVFWGG